VTTAELEKAEVLADRLLTAVGAREQAPVNVSIAAQDRNAAFTLFISTYDDARRAATFFRGKRTTQNAWCPLSIPAVRVAAARSRRGMKAPRPHKTSSRQRKAGPERTSPRECQGVTRSRSNAFRGLHTNNE
jgi:hypothetical protein